MHNDPSTKSSWLERISHALARPKNRQELLDWLQDVVDHNLIEHDALRMIEGVLQVYEMQVRDVMIPRSQMVVIELDTPLEEILPIVISSAHSRFPVIKESRDEVLGILLAKDLLPYTIHHDAAFDLSTLLRPAAFIPESKRLNVLLEEFRLNRNHIAIVVDEYGSVSGMLTIEDVLEEIVGEIEDEYDVEVVQTNISQINDTQFIVKALIPIEEFNHFFHMQLDDEKFDTIGGLIINQFAHFPKKDETTLIDGLEFKVLHGDKRRLRLVQVTLPHPLAPTE
jgi:magnesium and cobalt transporter